jgi:S-DNA-T family DNA segregation ATPase FtsK/SpoIIIE
VASKVDSRTVLDANGADKLLGKGDLLFLRPGEVKPIRGQGTLTTDSEISRVVKFITDQNPGEAPERLDWDKVSNSHALEALTEKDELYVQAVRVVCETRQASVSVLQRRLRLGYGRAARILDMMEQEGIVGPLQGTRSREILVDKAAPAS